MATDAVAAQLIQIAKDKTQPAAARVSAANSVLDRAGLKPDADLQQARAQAIRVSLDAQQSGSGEASMSIEVVYVDQPGG
jgi:hypothetical protein